MGKLSEIAEFTGSIVPAGSFVPSAINDSGSFVLRKVSPDLLGATGPQGIPGNDGATFRQGSGAPAAALGNNGDFYIDSGNGNLYEKTAGAWALVSNLRGPQGVQGIQGIQGVAGANGADGADAEPGGAVTQVQYHGGGAPAVLAGDAAFTYDDTNDELSVDNIKLGLDTIAYAASIALDFREEGFRTVTLAGNLTITTSNLAVGRSLALRIVADGSLRTLTFPATWDFLGTKPADIAASKVGVLSLTSFSTTDADVVAAWAVEA
jgi:hypothetical protein